MDDSDMELTEEDWEAAREALRRTPALAESSWDANPERKLAGFHRQWGSSRFQLRFGLREPASYPEQCDLEFFLGQITMDELRERMLTYVHRPIDQPMLDTFLKECEECVRRYIHFVEMVSALLSMARSRILHSAEEAEADRLASTLCGSSKLYKQEISSVRQFLQEARVMKQMGNVEIGQFLAPTAAELVTLVTYRVQKSWEEMQELALDPRTRLEYGRVMLGIELFEMQCYPDLPSPLRLETLLLEESALARVVLREQLASARTEGGDNTTDQKEQGRKTTSPLISVECWSDLAIGIDERGTYWAVTPPPSPGEVFPKSQAVLLPLSRERWKVVLHAFADATEIDQVRRDDLIRMLGYLPPPSSVDRDQWARPGAVKSSQVDGMEVRKLALERFNDTLTDLRRKLRRFVSCPKKGRQTCLRTEGAVIRSVFRVRYLMRDESDRVIFGQPRQ